MIHPLRSIGVAAVLAVALSACHSQQKAGHGEVSGQILPGSISDAMLPYDAVKSKAPLAPREVTEHRDITGGDELADSSDAAASGSSAAPEVAASPGPIAPAPVE